MDGDMIAPFVCSCLPVIELSLFRQSNKAWKEAVDQSSIWCALAQFHFNRTLAKDIGSRADFVQTVLALRKSLRSCSVRENWLDMAFSPQPCPPSDMTGLALLLEFHAQTWVVDEILLGPTPHVGQHIKLLDLLTSRSIKARDSLRLKPKPFYHKLVQIVEHYMVSQMTSLHDLRPQVGRGPFGRQVISFESLDCRMLSLEDDRLKSLRAGCSLICNLFSDRDDVRSPGAELAKDWQQSMSSASAELSGEWRTAVSCQFQRLDYVPGNLEIQFESSGKLQGSGRDGMNPYQDFDLTGFWNTEIVLMRKLTTSYTVDLFGFFEADGSIRGAWILSGMSGGFWACRGQRRDWNPWRTMV